MIREAHMSPCGLYRYTLTRRWGEGPSLAWVMLNPSTADADADDATIRKCIGFTRRIGYHALIVVNLFAFRATDPAKMKTAADPIGPDNDMIIHRVCGESPLIVCAWGRHGAAFGRAAEVMARLDATCAPTVCWHINADGSPGHPLMLGYDRPLRPFGQMAGLLG